MGMFDFISGAAEDIFGGQMRNKGLQIEAEGTRITAEGTRLKAAGLRSEAENYDLAAGLAQQNEQFTRVSTAIKNTQADRQIYLGLGTTQAGVGGSGFAMSGSALDIMRSGAQQGALTKQVITAQGLITEAGFHEQAQAYTNMAGAARYAASVQDDIASRQDALAGKQDDLGAFAESAGYATGGLKMLTGFASLFL